MRWATKAQAASRRPTGPTRRRTSLSPPNKVCQKTRDRVKGVQPVSNPDDPAEVAAFLEKLLPATQTQATGLAALKPAPDVAAEWTALLAKQQEVVALFTTVLAKAKAKDPSGKEDLARSATQNPTFAELANQTRRRRAAPVRRVAALGPG